MLAELKRARAELEIATSKKRDAEKTKADAKESLEAEIGPLLDKKALISTINEIYRVAEVRKAWASQKADELQERLAEQFEPLRDAGWTIYEVTRVYNASKNKLTKSLCDDAERAIDEMRLVKIEE